jgi:bacillithiol synthase
MNTTSLSFKETAAFSALATQYIEQPGFFNELLAHPATEAGIWEAKSLRSGFPQANREILVDSIHRQYANIQQQQVTASQIDRLLASTTFTVTTAHQPNLFGGPAYFIYKIAGAVALANRLNAKAQGHFVPVYWMGAEDHDLDELNHACVFGQKLSWDTAQTGAVGRMSLADLQPVVAQLKDILGDSMHATSLFELIERCYQPQYTLAQATRSLVDALFGAYGLVVVDGDDEALKALFVPVMQDELEHGASHDLVVENAAVLEAKGFKAQIYPRDINLFWLEKGVRERIVKTDTGFGLAKGDKTWSKSAMLSDLTQQPASFSPNVVLRPLYQELVLPNVAFIGGGAEVAYWMLLPKVFKRFKVYFPVVLLRASAMVIEKSSQGKLEKLGLRVQDVFAETEDIIKTFIAQHESGVFSLETTLERLEALYAQAAQEVNEVDPSLKGAVLAEGKKAEAALKGLESRVRKSQKQRHETELNQIRALKSKLFPDNHLQERHDNFMNFYLTHGADFISHCVAEMDPLRKEFFIFS